MNSCFSISLLFQMPTQLTFVWGVSARLENLDLFGQAQVRKGSTGWTLARWSP